MRRETFLRAAGAAAAVGTLAPAAQAQIMPLPQNQPLTPNATLALVAPFTGRDVHLGDQLANGVREAIDYVNQFRGALDKVYGLRTIDDQNLPALAQTSAEFAVEDPTVFAVIGHLNGRITEQALNIYSNAHMPVVVPASTYDGITAHGYGGVVRLTTKDSTEGALAATYFIEKYKPKKPVIVVSDGEYGADVAQAFLQKCKVEKIAAQLISFKLDKTDYAAVAKSVLEAAPDFVYFAGTSAAMGQLVDPLRAGKYGGPLAASQGFFDVDLTAADVAKFEGLTASTSLPPLELAPSAFRYRSDYETRYGEFTPLAVFGYAAAQVAMAAIKRTGATNRAMLASQLTIGGFYDTIVGTYQFSGTGDPIDPNVYFYEVKKAKWTYQKAAHPTSFLMKS